MTWSLALDGVGMTLLIGRRWMALVTVNGFGAGK